MTMRIRLLNATLLIGISTSSLQCGSVARINTTQITDLSGRWNDTDARLVAEEMTQDIVKRSWVNNFINNTQRKPVIIVGEILNKSHEHIDTEPFIKDIEKELINAQAVKIVAHGSFRNKLRNQRQEQNQIANEGKSLEMHKNFSKELGADFMLFGSINTIVDSKAEGKHRVIFYQVNLELVDLETNEIVWIGDKKIKKYVKK